MSCITEVYLDIKLKLNTDKKVIDWLTLNNDRKYIETHYDEYEKHVPSVIIKTASRCGILNIEDNDFSYIFTTGPSWHRLLLRSNNKNKDEDYERFINYLMPFIIKDISIGYMYTDCSFILSKILFEKSNEPDVLKIEIVDNSSEAYIDLLKMSVDEIKEIPNLKLDPYYY